MYRKANTNGQTKMIIITSDEDLIRQLALNKRPDTRIVDLDRPNQHLAANPNEKDMIDLAFLAELSTHVRIGSCTRSDFTILLLRIPRVIRCTSEP